MAVTIPISASVKIASIEARIAALEAAFDESSGGGGTRFWPMQCTDQTTPIVIANNIYGDTVPFDMTVTEIQASLRNPHASGTFTVRVKIDGSTVFSTNLTIDANEDSSLTAAAGSVITNTAWSSGDAMTVDIVDDADGTASGLQLKIISQYAPSDLFAPTVPGSPTVTPDGATEMDISWSAATDNIGVTGYTLQRATNAGFTANLATIPLGNVLTYHDTGLTGATTYYYREKARDAAGLFSAYSAAGSGTTGTPPPPDPTNVTGLYRWHDADAITGLVNNDPVSQWDDESGNARHATAAGGTRPLYKTNAVNSLPALLFDGVDDFLALGDMDTLTEGEAFVVLKLDADPPVAECGLWFIGGSNNALVPSTVGGGSNIIYDDAGSTVRHTTVVPSTSMASWCIYSVHSATNDWSNYLNGVVLDHETTSTVVFPFSATLGKNASGQLFGHIAEFIVYDHKLSAPDRAIVMAYLEDKYGL